MPTSLHQSRAERAADWIKQRIHEGDFKERLPGLRELARLLNVSVPTISQALHLLEPSGWVIGRGERHGFQIPPNRPTILSPAATPATHRRLLFLTSPPMNQLLQDTMRTLVELVNVMQPEDWEVIHRANGFERAKSPHQSWNRMLDLIAPDALVVLSGTPAIAKWATHRKIPTLFVGGQSGGHPLPQISVNITDLIRDAIDQLHAKGHANILMPLCGRPLELGRRILKAAQSRLTEVGGSPNCFHIEESTYNDPKVLMDLLKRTWKKSRPDAIVLLDWREFVTVSCFLKEQYLRIPADLSVVLLSHEKEMDWHFPALAHYRYPSERIAHAIARWAAHDAPSGTGEYPKHFKAQWFEGDSIASR